MFLNNCSIFNWIGNWIIHYLSSCSWNILSPEKELLVWQEILSGIYLTPVLSKSRQAATILVFWASVSRWVLLVGRIVTIKFLLKNNHFSSIKAQRKFRIVPKLLNWSMYHFLQKYFVGINILDHRWHSTAVDMQHSSKASSNPCYVWHGITRSGILN